MSSSPPSSSAADDASMTHGQDAAASAAETVAAPLTRRARREAEAAETAAARTEVAARAPRAPRAAGRASTTPAVVASLGSAVAAAPARTVAAGRHVVANAARIAAVGGVMAVAASLAIGMTVPATSLMATASSETVDAAASATTSAPRVAVVAEAVDAAAVAPAPSRDSYTAGSSAALQMASYQAAGLGYAPGYVPTTGSIRWPFPYSTTMSSGFGEYRGDSIHTGLDFNPGIGSPVQSIAAGTVISAGWGPTSALGYYVVVQHEINGELIESTYAHMIDGSSSLAPGQSIPVGTIVGEVGNTGLSTGPHLHLIIKVNGVAVDPYEWLSTNATNK